MRKGKRRRSVEAGGRDGGGGGGMGLANTLICFIFCFVGGVVCQNIPQTACVA